MARGERNTARQHGVSRAALSKPEKNDEPSNKSKEKSLITFRHPNIPLKYHTEIHQIGERAFELKYKINLWKTAYKLLIDWLWNDNG